MKKNYIFTFLLTLMISGFAFAQDLVITGAFDGPNTGGTPKGIEIYVLNNIADLSIYGVGSANNGGGTDGEEFTFPAVAVTAGTFIYVASEETQFTAFFGFAPTYNAGSAMGINGDDAVELFMNGAVIDTFGDIDMDGTGEAWDHVDGWAYRKDGTGPEGATFTVTNWTYSGTNQLEGGSTNAATNSPFPLGTYSPTAATGPSISFTAPTNNQIFPATTTDFTIMFNVDNFTLSGDAGGGVSDNTGDGFIKGSSTKNGAPDGGDQNIFSLNGGTFNLDPGSNYTLTAELVDNSGASLTPKVEVTVAFSVADPCDLVLGAITTTCDATTAGTDTYAGSIAFTGGDTGITYTITAPAGVTVGGDDPNSVAAGTITFTGMTEGTNYDINIAGGTGSSCDYDRTFFSPNCYSLPFTEPFDYPADTDLIAQPLWRDASTSSTPNNIQVRSNDIGGGAGPVLGNFYLSTEFPDQTGNMVSLVGGGSDPYIGFQEVTSGIVYASFMFHVTNMDDFKTNTSGDYFAVLTENVSFRGRLYIKDPSAGVTDDGTQFNVGVSTGGTVTYHNAFTANIGEPVFVVLGYDLDNDELKLWVVPDATTFGTNTPPAANVTLTGATAGGIDRFLLRQDRTSDTPSIDFDELRVGTSWSEVAPTGTTASVGENQIDGFAAYPNPVRGNNLTITTESSDTKEVQIFNVLGRRVFTETFTSNRKTLDISEISSGIYILKVIEGDRIATQKIIKE